MTQVSKVPPGPVVPARRVFVALLALAAAVLPACRSFAAEELLRIDLGKVTGPATFRASGFLHGMSIAAPPQELVAPLKPRLFRSTAVDIGLVDRPGMYERARALGATVQLELSSSHGCVPCPGENGDWTHWDRILDYLLKEARQKGYRIEQWDIWNEPDLQHYWNAGFERYQEMWARTVRKIRAADTQARIVGPSISRYDREWLQRFLLWAKANDVLPDIISWHEFEDPGNIPARVDDLRGFLRANGIPVRPVSLNEIVGARHLTRPGPTVEYLWAVERAGVESAAHACWDDEEEGVSGCSTYSLDGILVPATKEPRSVWWVYRRYADLTGMLASVERSRGACALAAVDSEIRQAGILVGCNRQGAADVRLELENLDRVAFLSGKVLVTVERIPDRGWRPLQKPEILERSERRAVGGRMTIRVPDVGPEDALFVRIRPSVTGLDTTGLLVRCWGTVRRIAPPYFWIDDGTNYRESGQPEPGIRVMGECPVQPGRFVQVTGIRSLLRTDGGLPVPLLRMRGASDAAALD